MRLFISISIFLASLSDSFSQEYNKKNEYGQKTGEWIEYYPEGFVKLIRHHTPLEFKPDTFFLSQANSESKDTIISVDTDYVKTNYGFEPSAASMGDLSKLDWIKTFEYDSNWELVRVLKRDVNQKLTYLYGTEQEIGIVDHTYEIEGVIGNNSQISIPLENYSDSSVNIRFEDLPQNIDAQERYQAPSNSEYTVILNVILEAGDQMYTINLVGDNFDIELLLNTESYHYTRSDFQGVTPLIISYRKLIIKRTNSEALLTILNPVDDVIKQIPLSHELAEVDLTDLTAGEYIFVFTDYSDGSKLIKNIELE